MSRGTPARHTGMTTTDAPAGTTAQPTDEPTIQPTTTGYVEHEGVRLYVETYGQGAPLVLLHGGMLSIDLDFATLVPDLARTRTVVGIELQGHGRTADTDRPVSYASHAGDVVAVLDSLGHERATVLGHSMGAGTALELAVRHPDRVDAVVAVSGSVRKEGLHPDLGDPSVYATSPIMPTADDFAAMRAEYERLSPHPERFDAFMLKLNEAQEGFFAGWSDAELAGVRCPVLFVQGDRDFTTVDHAALMLRLVAGSQLAVLPGTTHMDATRKPDLLLPVLHRFLDGL